MIIYLHAASSTGICKDKKKLRTLKKIKKLTKMQFLVHKVKRRGNTSQKTIIHAKRCNKPII